MLHHMTRIPPRTPPKILLVKTSSLGDVVHNLPLVNDIHAHFPGAQIDWVAETSFAAIPRMHAGVNQVFPASIRRWRRGLLHTETRRELKAFFSRLRAHDYDAIIDTQGLLKSAIVTRAARGMRFGLDWKSSREPLRLFYDRTFRVPWGQHAVVRNRSLAAQALGYALPAQTTFGIIAPQRSFTWLPAARFAVLLHATSADRKLWPESHWVELHNYLILNNIISVLPWGNAAERARSERLAATMPQAVVPPALALEDVAALLAQAQAVIGVDTGLTHLAAALDVPTVGIYCATDPAATGIHACQRALNLGGIGTPTAAQTVIAALAQLGVA
jgi:heptosyltransferase-1